MADPCSVSWAVHMTRSDMLNLLFYFLMIGQFRTEADQGHGDQDLHGSRPLHKTRCYRQVQELSVRQKLGAVM